MRGRSVGTLNDRGVQNEVADLSGVACCVADGDGRRPARREDCEARKAGRVHDGSNVCDEIVEGQVLDAVIGVPVVAEVETEEGIRGRQLGIHPRDGGEREICCG